MTHPLAYLEKLRQYKYKKIIITGCIPQTAPKKLKGYPLLEGYRGQEPVDVANLENLLLKVSDFVEKHPEIKEIDLNPIFAYSKGAVAVDARVILEESK